MNLLEKNVASVVKVIKLLSDNSVLGWHLTSMYFLSQIQSFVKMWKAKRKYNQRLHFFKEHVSNQTSLSNRSWTSITFCIGFGSLYVVCVFVCLCVYRKKKS